MSVRVAGTHEGLSVLYQKAGPSSTDATLARDNEYKVLTLHKVNTPIGCLLTPHKANILHGH